MSNTDKNREREGMKGGTEELEASNFLRELGKEKIIEVI